MNHHSFEFYGLAFFGIILTRYLIFAGGTQLVLHKMFGQAIAATKPTVDRQTAGVANTVERIWMTTATRRDIKLSIESSIVFALSAAAIASAYEAGYTRLYADIDRYPLWYLVASYLVAIVLQDLYFYFMHRLFHHRLLFRWWHCGHHRSPQPTPWTSFAFDPPEAIVHSLFLVGIVFVLPLHFISAIAVVITMSVWAVVNHLGLERLPANFPHHWCGRWFIGPAHHDIHHHQSALHYGLYFTFWDRQLGTQSPNYDQEFTNVID